MDWKIIMLVIILLLLDSFVEEYKKSKTDHKDSKKIMSKSEYRIAEYLDKLNVRYKLQYTFKGCRDKKCLPFDFAIIDEKGKVLLLIEYDGEQHFHPVKFHNCTDKVAIENFKKCQKHDAMKNRFCSRRKIPLLRISYLDNKNMYKIIKRTLYQYNIIK